MVNKKEELLDLFIKNPNHKYQISELLLLLGSNERHIRNLVSELLKESRIKKTDRGVYQLENSNSQNIKQIRNKDSDQSVLFWTRYYKENGGNPRIHGLKIGLPFDLDYDALGKEWIKSTKKELKTLTLNKTGFGTTRIHITPKSKDSEGKSFDKPKIIINYSDEVEKDENKYTLDHSKLMEWKGYIESSLELKSNIKLNMNPFIILEIGIGKYILIGQNPEFHNINHLNTNMKFGTYSGLTGEIYLLNPNDEKEKQQIRVCFHEYGLDENQTFEKIPEKIYNFIGENMITQADFSGLNKKNQSIEQAIMEIKNDWKNERTYYSQQHIDTQNVQKGIIKYVDSSHQTINQLKQDQDVLRQCQIQILERFDEQNKQSQSFNQNYQQIDDKIDNYNKKVSKVLIRLINETRAYQDQNEQDKKDTNWLYQDLMQKLVQTDVNHDITLNALKDVLLKQDITITTLKDILVKQDQRIEKLEEKIEKESKIKRFFKRIF